MAASWRTLPSTQTNSYMEPSNRTDQLVKAWRKMWLNHPHTEVKSYRSFKSIIFQLLLLLREPHGLPDSPRSNSELEDQCTYKPVSSEKQRYKTSSKEVW